MTDEMSREALESRVMELYQAGMDAYEREAVREALPPWSQCLAGLRQLGENRDMVAILLYYCGTMYATFDLANQALAFFDASAYILGSLPHTAENADTLLIIGQSLTAIGQAYHAIPVIKQAKTAFSEIGDEEMRETASQELAAAQAEIIEEADIHRRTYRFGIRHGKTAVVAFSVDASGAIQWQDRASEPDPLAGDDPAWNVKCIGTGSGKKRKKGGGLIQKLIEMIKGLLSKKNEE